MPPWKSPARKRGTIVSLMRSYAAAHYQGLDNVVPQQYLQFAFLGWLRPKFYCLNDNFGWRPSPLVVGLARRFLARYYPHASRFERVAAVAARRDVSSVTPPSPSGPPS